MSTVLLIFLIAPLVLVLFMYLSGTRSLRKLITVPIAFYSLPVLVVVGFYILRTPIQQGKFLAQLGPILSLVFPPEDLYDPLATKELVNGKKEYTLSFTHKYVGHHAVEISVPGKVPFGQIEPELQVSLEVFEGDTLLYKNGSVKGSGFWGRDDHGLHFAWYNVPEDLPVSKSLTAKITISGDLSGFLNERKGTTLSVTKVSDE
jgi:hypothetical protein